MRLCPRNRLVVYFKIGETDGCEFNHQVLRFGVI